MHNISYTIGKKNTTFSKEPADPKMKECMYSYHYHRKRAIVQRDQSSRLLCAGIIGVAILYGAYCLSTLLGA